MNTERAVKLVLHYSAGVIVLISTFMIVETWNDTTHQSIAWILALIGWLPDFLAGPDSSEDGTE